MVRVLKIDPGFPDGSALEEARSVLARGGLVIVPTETVYGIACDPAVPGALAKLAAAKGRDGNKPVARLAASPGQAKALATNWNPGLQALAETFWPGPLTLVLETADGWTGFRVPDHAVATTLARLCGHTLALSSANLSGNPDTKTAVEAVAAVAADLVLDSGPTAEQAIPSTVVKVDGPVLECLREGKISFAAVKAVFREGLTP